MSTSIPGPWRAQKVSTGYSEDMHALATLSAAMRRLGSALAIVDALNGPAVARDGFPLRELHDLSNAFRVCSRAMDWRPWLPADPQSGTC